MDLVHLCLLRVLSLVLVFFMFFLERHLTNFDTL